jgi:hypothetical protein
MKKENNKGELILPDSKRHQNLSQLKSMIPSK